MPVCEFSRRGMVLSPEYTVAEEEKTMFFTPCSRIVSQRTTVEYRLLS